MRELAYVDDPTNAAPEIEWINSRTRLLGESFGKATRRIAAMVEEGLMIEVKPVKEEETGMDNCVDISHWQPDFNMEEFAKAGGKAVILKATEGTTYVDDTYEVQRANAEMAGLAVSTYHFLRPGDMRAQARHYLEVVEPEDGERMVADHEDAGVLLGDLVTFLQEIQAYNPTLQLTIYSGHLLKEQLGSSKHPWLADNTSLWVAQYTSAAAPSWPAGTYKTWSLWQYTQGGKVEGFNGPVDCNRFNGSEDQMLDWFGPAGEAPSEEMLAEGRRRAMQALDEVRSRGGATVDLQVIGDVCVSINGKIVYGSPKIS
jgi:lysozyme